MVVGEFEIDKDKMPGNLSENAFLVTRIRGAESS